jgi:hypothetical protein
MKRTSGIDEVYRGKGKPMSIAEYRKIVKDTESTDERIQERIDYIASLCRNIIRIELEKAQYERLSKKCSNIALSRKPNYTP